MAKVGCMYPAFSYLLHLVTHTSVLQPFRIIMYVSHDFFLELIYPPLSKACEVRLSHWYIRNMGVEIKSTDEGTFSFTVFYNVNDTTTF